MDIIIPITCAMPRAHWVMGVEGNHWPNHWPDTVRVDRFHRNVLKNMVGPGVVPLSQR